MLVILTAEDQVGLAGLLGTVLGYACSLEEDEDLPSCSRITAGKIRMSATAAAEILGLWRDEDHDKD